MSERYVAAGLAALAVVLLGKAASTYSSLGSLLGPVYVLAGLGVVLLVLRGRPRAGRPGHSHGGDRARVARHEAGHVVAARAVGGRVLEACLHSNGGGHVRWEHKSHPGEEALRERNVAFLLAGEYAAGSAQGCSGDRRAVRRELARLPAGDRARVLARGKALARRIVSSRPGEISQVERRLNERGTL